LAKDTSGAKQYMAKAASVQGYLAEALGKANRTLESRKQFDEASALFRVLIEAGEIEPDFVYSLADVEWKRGLMEWEQGENGEPSEYLLISLERLGLLVEAQSENARYLFELGKRLMRCPDPSYVDKVRAEGFLRRALELQPKNKGIAEAISECVSLA